MNNRSSQRNLRAWVALVAGLVATLLLAGDSARAGSLTFWEASSAPGVPLWITPPATAWPLDIDYAPNTAEGSGLYGFGEVTLATTGDLTLTNAGFACQTFGCLYFPSPFLGGDSITASGADNLAGEFAGSADFMTLAVTGTNGHVAIVSGRYLDAGGVAQTIGNIQEVSATIIATVPEPTFGAGVALASLLLAAMTRRRRGALARFEG